MDKYSLVQDDIVRDCYRDSLDIAVGLRPSLRYFAILSRTFCSLWNSQPSLYSTARLRPLDCTVRPFLLPLTVPSHIFLFFKASKKNKSKR